MTARFDRPFVKVFREEREQTIFFIVDVSASLDFGRARTKREAVSELSALLAYAAIKSNDKVGGHKGINIIIFYMDTRYFKVTTIFEKK